MAKKSDDAWVKVGGGGAWKGALWFPAKPTDHAVEQAGKYGNEIVEEKEITGTLFKGVAFGKKEIYYLKTEEHGDLAVPDHTALSRDLELAYDERGEGCEVKITYKGVATIKSGKYKGKEAHTYDVLARAAED